MERKWVKKPIFCSILGGFLMFSVIPNAHSEYEDKFKLHNWFNNNIELPLKSRSIIPLIEQFRSHTFPEIVDPSTYSGETITVYRGVRHRSKVTFPKILRLIDRLGVVDKNSLQRILPLNPDDESYLEEARKIINESKEIGSKLDLGMQILNHLIGNWYYNTHLVSTTLDINIAADFAGGKGRVYTFEIPIEEALIVDELNFWKDSQIQNTRTYLREVVVLSQVKPAWITNIQKLSELPGINTFHTHHEIASFFRDARLIFMNHNLAQKIGGIFCFKRKKNRF